MFEKLDGYKTYIGAVIVFIGGGINALCNLPALGVCVGDDIVNSIIAVGIAVSVFGLRHAVKKAFGK